MDENKKYDDLDIKNLNEEDTIYFTDIDKADYESNQKVYTEEDMYENYKPLTNTNSVEYDEGDYASPFYGLDREKTEDTKKVIFAYIFTLLIIIFIVLIAVLRLN